MPSTSDQRTLRDPAPDPMPHSVPASADAAAPRARARRYAVLVGIALGLALLVRALLVEAVHLPDTSMTPALQPGDRLLMLRTASPARGDVVLVDTAPAWGADRTTYVDAGPVGRVLGAAADALGVDLDEQGAVLRVVAVGGDEVQVREDGSVFVAGRAVRAASAGPAAGVRQPVVFRVQPGRVWVLADQPGQVADSMTHVSDPAHGSLAASDVLGTAWVRYWPLGSLGAPGGQR